MARVTQSPFHSGRSEHFDRVIVCHGPDRLSKENGFAWISQQDIEQLRARNDLGRDALPPLAREFFDPHIGWAPVTSLFHTAGSARSSAPARLPPQDHNFGREELKRQLVERLLSGQPPPTTVLGPPGIGKSTLTLAALHDKDIQRRYGPHRYFIHLDDVDTATGLNSELAQALGLPPGPEFPARLETFFGGKPALLILDNAETPGRQTPGHRAASRGARRHPPSGPAPLGPRKGPADHPPNGQTHRSAPPGVGRGPRALPLHRLGCRPPPPQAQ